MDKKFSSVDIFGVRVDTPSMDQAVEQVVEWVMGNGRHYIVTPNPEFIIIAQKDLEFKKVLNQADLSIPDGAGLKLAADIQSTTPGVDLMEELIKVSAKKGFTIGLLGGGDLVAVKLAECLKKKYPGLKVVFAESGGMVDEEGRLPRLPRLPRLDILFVAFGQVKQEKWIAQNLSHLPVKVAMGVGGAFDYLSGLVPRAPKLMRNLGLEWLFRLVLQPWRIKRQLVLIKFVFMVISTKFSITNDQ